VVVPVAEAQAVPPAEVVVPLAQAQERPLALRQAPLRRQAAPMRVLQALVVRALTASLPVRRTRLG